MSVWDQLVGQESAVEVLRQAAAAAAQVVAGEPVAAGAMTHAWLFTGPPGSGRSVAARAFAAALQCRQAVGCGACTGCRLVAGGTHPDVHSVIPEGLSITVAEMRAVVGVAERRPSLGHWQAVVIEDADRLTEQASNALLKAIEEPPAGTVFLLCAPSTHPDDVSVTVRSRCRVVSLRTPSAAAITEVLLRAGADPERAHWAAQAAQGHVGRARRLATDEQARQRRSAVLSVPAGLTSLGACLAAAERLVKAAEAESEALTEPRDASELSQLQTALGAGGTGRGSAGVARGTVGVVRDLEKRQKARSTRSQRDALDRALIDLAGFYRDVLLHHANAAVPVAHPDVAEQVTEVARRVDAPGALQRLEAVLACRAALDLNVKPRVAVEAMTATLRLP